MPAIPCPDSERLSAYLRGSLPEDQSAAISVHLETCLGCRSIVTSLRQAGEAGRPPSGPAAEGPAAPVAANPSEPPRGASLVGELGEYRLLEKLGEGGMGAVYKALHTRLEKVVALKTLRRSLMEDESLVSRFEREMKAVGRLNHPNVIQAYDAREIAGTRFLVTEFIDGVNLAELVRRRGPLRVADACELCRQASLGLQAAHEHGLVHRDIKPSNLMLTRAGQVKILDLGLARLQAAPQAAGTTTAAGQIMGTADYMAPEQVSDCHGVDIRADIYSLGCTLFTLLTGQVLFGGPEHKAFFDKMAAHLLKPPPQLRQFRPEAPEPLSALLQRMLAKQPADRPSTPAEVAVTLAPLAAGCDLAAFWEPGEAEAAAAGTRQWDSSGAESLGPALTSATRTPTARLLAAVPTSLRRRKLLAGGLIAVCLALAAFGFWQAVRHMGPGVDSDVVQGPSKVSPASGPAGELPVGKPQDEKPPKPRIKKASGPYVRPDPAPAKQLQADWAKRLGIPVEQTNSIGMKMVLVPPGEFVMGTPDASPAFTADMAAEGPAHRVKLVRPFLLSVDEVTQAEYERVMGGNPSHFSARGEGRNQVSGQDTARHPVETISWKTASEFCRRLSTLQEEHSARRTYRLPTEAEWEYACRAGTSTLWYFGDEEALLPDCAWLMPDSGGVTHSVGQKEPNAWGLHDMVGNVFEWCSDWYAPDYYAHSPVEDPVGPPTGLEHVIRGGSWWNTSAHCRSAARVGAPAIGNELIGFRVVCEVPIMALLVPQSASPPPAAEKPQPEPKPAAEQPAPPKKTEPEPKTPASQPPSANKATPAPGVPKKPRPQEKKEKEKQ